MKRNGDDDHDLGLSLSLKCPRPKSPPPIPSISNIAFGSYPATKAASGLSNLQGKTCTKNNFRALFDINKLPAEEVLEPVPLIAVSSPDRTIPNSSRKQRDRVENEFQKYSNSSEGGGADDSLGSKRLKLSKDQETLLTKTFNHQRTLDQNEKLALAKELNIPTRQVQVWFQNRKARSKHKETEVEKVSLRRRREILTEENSRLRKELDDLKAENNFAMRPPTTLKKCHNCRICFRQIPG